MDRIKLPTHHPDFHTSLSVNKKDDSTAYEAKFKGGALRIYSHVAEGKVRYGIGIKIDGVDNWYPMEGLDLEDLHQCERGLSRFIGFLRAWPHTRERYSVSIDAKVLP